MSDVTSSNPNTITGSCNCGSIKITIPRSDQMVLCHCTSCRKSGGSMASSNFSIPTKDLIVEGSEPKQYKNKGTSGGEVTRNFCGECGPPLWTAVADPSSVFVKGGLFDPHTVPQPNAHLFGEEMEDWEIVQEGAERLETQ
ncbi:hypothetical protein I203_105429 [Kwoniella mangroviensis CBS 8507]|uniref:uncharacterized protein n=1 Tax=Kwoniella mangroviensis CBS 8507 TaxID=1296122 RepID=UPI00080D36FF|nr:uncharacterized protein I203_01242 [Kwoniella mangroviensis CBS 8507]OCF69385.1 hypothetical protein I203_01242 [Kwoniella mangroviensis CBS 8507]